MSSAEAEYTAATEAGKEIKWVRALIKFMLPKLKQPPTPMLEDNSACRSMAKNSQVSGRNKHFELKQHYIRELVNSGIVQLIEVGTKEQIADAFTKPLARPAFEKHRKLLLSGLPADFDPNKTAPQVQS